MALEEELYCTSPMVNIRLIIALRENCMMGYHLNSSTLDSLLPSLQQLGTNARVIKVDMLQ